MSKKRTKKTRSKAAGSKKRPASKKRRSSKKRKVSAKASRKAATRTARSSTLQPRASLQRKVYGPSIEPHVLARRQAASLQPRANFAERMAAYKASKAGWGPKLGPVPLSEQSAAAQRYQKNTERNERIAALRANAAAKAGKKPSAKKKRKARGKSKPKTTTTTTAIATLTAAPAAKKRRSKGKRKGTAKKHRAHAAPRTSKKKRVSKRHGGTTLPKLALMDKFHLPSRKNPGKARRALLDKAAGNNKVTFKEIMANIHERKLKGWICVGPKRTGCGGGSKALRGGHQVGVFPSPKI